MLDNNPTPPEPTPPEPTPPEPTPPEPTPKESDLDKLIAENAELKKMVETLKEINAQYNKPTPPPEDTRAAEAKKKLINFIRR